ncbi:MAG: hypothetical protein IT334_07520 [Thermomicrobiales bacterium]|nr:hypothetical protein [Thermomicrobiales bacterium]
MHKISWLVIAVIAGQLFVSPALANEAGTPVAPAIEESTLEPTVTPADPRPSPTEIAPTPTAEAPAPTMEPTPLPTAPPSPTLSFALAAEPQCEPAEDQPAALASGGSIEYRCVSRLTLAGDAIAPAGIAVTWSIDATVTPGWRVQVQRPALTPGSEPVWAEAIDNTSHFSIVQPDAAGTSADVGALSTDLELTWRLRIERLACLAGSPAVELRHAATVDAPSVTGIDRDLGVIREPLRIEPELAAITAPSIRFNGPLDFGTIKATALGLSETRIDGQLSLTVTGLDQTCGGWDLWFDASPIVDTDGAVREGFALLIGECDLTDGCLAASFAAGPEAPATQSIMITITLQAPQYAALGALGTTIDATLIASADGI